LQRRERIEMPAPNEVPTPSRKVQIANAALRILAEAGPHRLTARELGAQVGIDNSTVFRHFANKGEIIDAALDEFEAVLEETLPQSAPSLAALKGFFTQRMALVQRRPEVIRLAFNPGILAMAGQEAHAARVRAIVGRSVEFIRSCLAAAQSAGEVTAEVPAHALVWVVTGILRGAVLGSESPVAPELAWSYVHNLLRKPGAAGPESGGAPQ
jgi:AcrR family transcriptional regulator